MDFTIKTYIQLLESLQKADYHFLTYAEYVSKSEEEIPRKNIVLRHDVDKLPYNSLRFAQIQSELGIKGTYYFRMHKHSYNETVIKKIEALGHEVGYHYETMDTASAKFKVQSSKFKVGKENLEYNQLLDLAYEQFCRNLVKFRKIVEIKTISMHGSPLSSFDNRAIWQKYDYKALGILAEPYFDLDFNATFYITDTGRRWDGHLFNVRDKATDENPLTNPEFLKLRFHSTADLIRAIERRGEMETKGLGDKETKGQGDKETGRHLNTGSGLHKTTSASISTLAFPSQAMLNFHPQRWNNNPYLWAKELVLQNAKNQVKRFLVKKR